MVPQNKNVRQRIWYLQYVGTAAQGSELYCYNAEGDINSVVNQASYRKDAIRLEHKMSKFTHGEAAFTFV